VLFAAGASAQMRSPAVRGIGPGHALGPAAGGAVAAAPARTNAFANRPGKIVAGQLPRRGIGSRPPHARPPLATVPPYFGYGHWGWGWAPPRQVEITVQNLRPPQPPVIINENYKPPEANPSVKDYADGDLPEPQGMLEYRAPVPARPGPANPAANRIPEPPSGGPTIYLLALKERGVFPVTGYWIESGALHFITAQGEHNHAPVDQLDEDQSKRLNRNRGVDFRIELP